MKYLYTSKNRFEKLSLTCLFRASVSGYCFPAKASMLLRAIVRVTECLLTKECIFLKYNGTAMQTIGSKGKSFLNRNALSNDCDL